MREDRKGKRDEGRWKMDDGRWTKGERRGTMICRVMVYPLPINCFAAIR